jgi:serine phosphatase RsbU (regulator of sigma subunit)
MNLRGRITVIMSICFLLLAGMLLLEGRSREAAVEARLDNTQLLGLSVSWAGLEAAERQRLLYHLDGVLRNPLTTASLLAADDARLDRATIAIRSDLRKVAFQAMSTNGVPIYTAGQAEPGAPFFLARQVAEVIAATAPTGGLALMPDGTLAYVMAAPVFDRAGVVGVVAVSSPAEVMVRELVSVIGVPALIMAEARGATVGVSGALTQIVAGEAAVYAGFSDIVMPLSGEEARLETIIREEAILRVVSVALPSQFMDRPPTLAAMRDVSAELSTRTLISWISYFALTSAVVLFLGFINWSLRRSFRPLNAVIQSLDALAEGRTETHVTLPTTSQNDEIGRLAGTFESFREGMEARASLDRLQQELDVAARIQTQCLPSTFPREPGMLFAAAMTPMREVGGDFYDVFRLPDNRIAVVIADVSDKGMGAALFMAISRTVVRSTALATPEPAECITRVNTYLCEDNEAMLFVTLFYAIIDPATGHMAYCNAGHNPPVLLTADGSQSFITVDVQPALGVWEDYPYEGSETILPGGSSLFLYTDGVTEAMTSDGEEMGETRLADALSEVPTAGVDELVAHMFSAVKTFVVDAPQSDDITCMAVAYRTAAAEAVAPSADVAPESDLSLDAITP